MKRHRRSNLNDIEKRIILRMLGNGESKESVCEKLNIAMGSLNGMLYKNFKTTAPKKLPKTLIRKASTEELENEIVELYRLGHPISYIAKIEGIDSNVVYNTILEGHIQEAIHKAEFEDEIAEGVTTKGVKYFRDNILKVGDKYRITVPELGMNLRFMDIKKIVTVVKKYKHIVLTDQGCFQYIDFINGAKV